MVGKIQNLSRIFLVIRGVFNFSRAEALLKADYHFFQFLQ